MHVFAKANWRWSKFEIEIESTEVDDNAKWKVGASEGFKMDAQANLKMNAKANSRWTLKQI